MERPVHLQVQTDSVCMRELNVSLVFVPAPALPTTMWPQTLVSQVSFEDGTLIQLHDLYQMFGYTSGCTQLSCLFMKAKWIH